MIEKFVLPMSRRALRELVSKTVLIVRDGQKRFHGTESLLISARSYYTRIGREKNPQKIVSKLKKRVEVSSALPHNVIGRGSICRTIRKLCGTNS